MHRHERVIWSINLALFQVIYVFAWLKMIPHPKIQYLEVLPVPRIKTMFLPVDIYFHTRSWCGSICHLSWRIAPLQEGCTYLHWGRCAQSGRDSACTGMTMENLIITVIFIPGKYTCGSLVLDLSVTPSPEYRDLSREIEIAFRGYAFTIKFLRYSSS